MGTDPGRTLGMRENGEMECWSDGVMVKQEPNTPVFHYSSIPLFQSEHRSEAWLILNMSRARNVMRSLWLARNFFVCRRLTVIVPIAAMNFRSAWPPAKRPRQRINAPVKQHHDAASSQGISRNEIPLYPPFSKGEETQCVSGFASARQIPLFEKGVRGDLCSQCNRIISKRSAATEGELREPLRRNPR
jgi:hypothetical protein